jgi:hypothetical protein
MKKIIATVCAMLFVVWLSGCSSTNEISLDKQGNLNCIQWGTPLSEAQKKLPEATLQGDTLEMEGLFSGFPVTLVLQFSPVSWSEDSILYEAAFAFAENADFDELTNVLNQLFGPAETQGETQNGEKYDLQETDFYWHGAQTLSQLADEDTLLASLQKTNPSVDTDRILYILKTMYPVTITMSRELRTLNLDAKYCVELGLLQ